ncbi:MAG TPA: YMGG-like glycine zipper-containing protein [Pyrinomonadaceae bacterium]|nr:YMGG-like glycine zipper-containing protein [Pyrinomonadaceae bacterium]
MRSKNRILMVFFLLLVGLGNASAALAQYRISQSEVQNLIRRIETRTDSLSRNLVNALDRSAINGTAREDEINRLVRDFESATDQLRTRVESRQSSATDARAVLDRAALINRFLLNNRLDYRVEQDWQVLRADLDRLAVAFNLGWRWDTTTGPISGSGSLLNDVQTRQLAQRIAVEATRFRRSFDLAVNRAAINNSSTEYQLRGHVGEFQLAANRLRDRVNRRQATTAEVQQLLEHARQIDTFMRTYELTPRAENEWSTLRTDLSALANSANIAWNWDTNIPGGPVYGNAQLTGTYRIDTNSGDDPRTVAENATRNLPTQRRDRIYQNLLNRLSPPEVLAIDQRGRNITIASSKAPQVALVADGREQVETTPQGRTARVSASLSGDQLIIARTGERAQDFTVTFDPVDSNRLLVTRQLYTEQVGQQVTVRTYYTRTSDVAQLDVYNSSPQYPSTGTASGDFIVPNGTQLVATLDTSLSTNNVREGERFTMTVRDSGQYQGAVIEGRVTNVSRSGRVTGRSELGLDFDTIRLRDGRTYRFAGILEGVRAQNGDVVRVDNEGAVRDSNQTTRTIQRGAIGAAIGAIIGAIAGGGQGAAIGAAVGAGAGAGSVYIQGRDDLQLEPGTEVTIRASGPR